MLRLTLLRHARAEPQYAGQEDWDRALEARGQRDAAEMARRLQERHLKPQRILTSPALRAISTAAIMARTLRVPAGHVLSDERLYLASARVLLTVIQELGGTAGHLMVVGHNPGISEFGDQIGAERRLDNMPTCALYTLQFDIGDWNELVWASGVATEFDHP